MNPYDLIPKAYHRTTAVHRSLTGDINRSILSAGFIHRKLDTDPFASSYFQYYGALLLLDGEGEYSEPNGMRRKLMPGSFIQRLPYREHTTIAVTGTWYETYFCFGMDVYDMLDQMNIIRHDPVIHIGLQSSVILECIELYKMLRTVPQDRLENALPMVLNMLLNVYNYARNDDAITDHWVQGICGYIDEHIHRSLSNDHLANQAGVGLETFRKQFRKSMGVSPGRYVIQRRVQRAQDMIMQSDESIQSIAIALGYADGYTFSKQFKQFIGMSPSVFRDRMR